LCIYMYHTDGAVLCYVVSWFNRKRYVCMFLYFVSWQ